MNDFPFCALETFLLMCLLKSNFRSRCKLKCFWETLRSTGTSSKTIWEWKSFTVFFFQKKKNYWACLVRSGNIIFHWYAHSEILFKSLLISSVETLMSFTINKIEVSSAKSLTLDIKLLGRSFMYIKNQFPMRILTIK